MKVDLIVTVTTAVALEAKNATQTIPIVMAVAADPVGAGVVDSLSRPGGNISGMTLTGPELASPAQTCVEAQKQSDSIGDGYYESTRTPGQWFNVVFVRQFASKGTNRGRLRRYFTAVRPKWKSLLKGIFPD